MVFAFMPREAVENQVTPRIAIQAGPAIRIRWSSFGDSGVKGKEPFYRPLLLLLNHRQKAWGKSSSQPLWVGGNK